jgi:hypothetical protein
VAGAAAFRADPGIEEVLAFYRRKGEGGEA